LGASLPFGVIDSFFVRTSDNSIRHYNTQDLMVTEESIDGKPDGFFQSYVGFVGKPALEFHDFSGFIGNDSDGDFARRLIIRSIESYGSCRIAPKTSQGFPSKGSGEFIP